MKNLKNLGKALDKAEQKTINGGKADSFNSCHAWCWQNYGGGDDLSLFYECKAHCDS